MMSLPSSYLLLVATLIGSAMAAKPLHRLQQTASAAATGSSSNAGGAAAIFQKLNAPVAASAMLPAVQPDAELKMMQDVWKNGANATAMIAELVNSAAFAVIGDNVEIQHKILEEMPLLAAYDGFRQAMGRKLSDDETKSSFAQGMQNVLSVTADAMAKMKDPATGIRKLTEMAATGDQATQDLFSRANEGDKDAFDSINDMLSAELFPGIDTSVLKNLAAERNLTRKMVESPEIMRFIDMDPIVSAVIRNPVNITNFVDEFDTKRKERRLQHQSKLAERRAARA